ncbi:MAG: VWA domain-containing protein [Acidobacteria bacterium]|nr:VWA domain-containing protein [Acidobacteriota bacterium]
MTLARAELLWLLLAAPLAAIAAVWLWRRRLDALSAWAARSLWHRLTLDAGGRHLVLSVTALALAVLAAAAALTEPRWGTIEETVEREGVDIVFVLDSSLSMVAADVKPDRITVARNLVREMTHRLPGHRVALVQAEGEGIVLAPLTVDSAVIDLLLDTVLPASLPTPGTLLRPALERAVALFPPDNQKHRAIVLLSDGEDHSEKEEAILRLLGEAGAVVYSLGIGSPQGAPIRLPGSDAYKQDEQGHVVVSKLNEKLLERMARETDGVYLRVSGLGVELEPVLDGINHMERRSIDGQVLSTLAQRFQWPLAVAALFLTLHLGASPLRPAREDS